VSFLHSPSPSPRVFSKFDPHSSSLTLQCTDTESDVIRTNFLRTLVRPPFFPAYNFAFPSLMLRSFPFFLFVIPLYQGCFLAFTFTLPPPPFRANPLLIGPFQLVISFPLSVFLVLFPSELLVFKSCSLQGSHTPIPGAPPVWFCRVRGSQGDFTLPRTTISTPLKIATHCENGPGPPSFLPHASSTSPLPCV